MLDTGFYEVEYIYRYKASLSTNTFAENIFSQVDEKGNIFLLFDEIVDHCVDWKEAEISDLVEIWLNDMAEHDIFKVMLPITA